MLHFSISISISFYFLQYNCNIMVANAFANNNGVVHIEMLDNCGTYDTN